MVYDKANELAKLLKESNEFREYKTTKEKAFENDTTASLRSAFIWADSSSASFSWRRRRQWCPVKRMMRRCSAFRR